MNEQQEQDKAAGGESELTVGLERLLPCPFCGGPVTLEAAHVQRTQEFGRRQFWGVVCRNTTNLGGSCCMEQVPSASKEAAVARWNMRDGKRSNASNEGTPLAASRSIKELGNGR